MSSTPTIEQAEWIDTNEQLDAFVASLADVKVYAVDTEFHREGRYRADLALVQVASRKRIALIDPLNCDIERLRPLLDSDATCIVHAARQDLMILHENCETSPHDVFDPQLAAMFCGYKTSALSKLLADFLRVEIDKSSQLADWCRRPLPKVDKNYAASDVAHLIELREKLLVRLRELGREEWALEEMKALSRVTSDGIDPLHAWWKLKQRNKLSGKSARIAQSVCAWRELTARAHNRPPSSLLNDMVIVAISMKPPTDSATFLRMRGVELGRTREFADAILSAIEEGIRMSPSDLRHPPEPPAESQRSTAVVSSVLAWLTQAAHAAELDPMIVATRSDVEAAVESGTGRVMQGWRYEAFGRTIEAYVKGELALVVTRGERLEMIAVPPR